MIHINQRKFNPQELNFLFQRLKALKKYPLLRFTSKQTEKPKVPQSFALFTLMQMTALSHNRHKPPLAQC